MKGTLLTADISTRTDLYKCIFSSQMHKCAAEQYIFLMHLKCLFYTFNKSYIFV